VEDESHYLYTNDVDLLQAVGDTDRVMLLKSFKSKLFPWGEHDVFEKYGVQPSSLPAFRAFTGDGADELQGVPRINKKYLGDLITWCDAMGFDNKRMLEEIRTAEGWSDKMRALITDFINAELWQRNYDLMQLEYVKCEITEPAYDSAFILECLKRWEIRTLKLCKPYRDELNELPDGEEF
jgi:5'-3' exonuclease